MNYFVSVVAERCAPVVAVCLNVLCAAGTVALILWAVVALLGFAAYELRT